MRPDYDDTEWRSFGLRRLDEEQWDTGSGPAWWMALIGLVILGGAIGVILYVALINPW